MGGNAGLTLLADAISSVELFIEVFVSVYGLLILVYIILSWIQLPYSTWSARIQQFLRDVCEPYLGIFRRFIPPLGPLDLSPMIGLLFLVIVEQVAINILDRFH
jgi:YggT family protein